MTTVTERTIDVLRVLHATGFVLAAGIPAFWAAVWPKGAADRRLQRLVRGGAGLSALAALAVPAVRWAEADLPLTQAVSREAGAAVLLELAALTLLVGLLGDLADQPDGQRSRLATGGAVAALSITVAAQSAATSSSGSLVTWLLLSVHLAAVATWVGGFVALLVLVVPGRRAEEFDDQVLAFLPIAYASLAALALSGALHGLLVLGGLRDLTSTSYGVWLLVKVALVAVMVAVGGGVRGYALDVAFRRSVAPAPAAATTTVGTLATVLLVEAGTAVLVLAATGVLVAVAP